MTKREKEIFEELDRRVADLEKKPEQPKQPQRRILCPLVIPPGTVIRGVEMVADE